MSKKKNCLREWLSNNLRYVLLGFAILMILVLLYIGFYFLVSLVRGTQLKDLESVQSELQVDSDWQFYTQDKYFMTEYMDEDRSLIR